MTSLRSSSTLSNLASLSFNRSALLQSSKLNSSSPIRYISSFNQIPNKTKSIADGFPRTFTTRSSSSVTSLQSSAIISTRGLSPRLSSSSFESSNLSSRFQSTSTATTSTRNDQPSSPTSSQSKTESTSSESQPESESLDSDEPPPKASFRERMRFLSRRYGWWALAVYLLASLIDFSLIFAAIHFLGAEHIKEWENWVREQVGMEKLKHKEEEDSTVSITIPGSGKELELVNNSKAAKEALQLREGSILTASSQTSNSDSTSNNSSQSQNGSSKNNKTGGGNASTLWTEAVLAYTIHKTLLLPFRVMFTAAVLPSFVKLMVRWGLSKPNSVVKNAAKQAHEKAARRKMAA